MPEFLAICAVFGAPPVIITLTALWLSARARARRAEALLHELTVVPALRGDAPSLGGLGTAVDAIALEVERISEGQRYLTRVLGERPARAPAAAPPRTITPH